jgi:hypothetical protein
VCRTGYLNTYDGGKISSGDHVQVTYGYLRWNYNTTQMYHIYVVDAVLKMLLNMEAKIKVMFLSKY